MIILPVVYIYACTVPVGRGRNTAIASSNYHTMLYTGTDYGLLEKIRSAYDYGNYDDAMLFQYESL